MVLDLLGLSCAWCGTVSHVKVCVDKQGKIIFLAITGALGDDVCMYIH